MSDTEPRLEPGKYCYYIPGDGSTVTPKGVIPVVVIEDESGYYPMVGNGEFASPWYWGDTIEKAERIAEESNARIGITPQRAKEIVSSSITASVRETGREQAFTDEWERLKRGLPR